METPVYHRPDVDKDGRQLHDTEHTTRKRVRYLTKIVVKSTVLVERASGCEWNP
ncbi:hypothetical protein IOM41_004531 [Salmonella enterica]|nr:hypothetical protein [Salmonella enterica]